MAERDEPVLQLRRRWRLEGVGARIVEPKQLVTAPSVTGTDGADTCTKVSAVELARLAEPTALLWPLLRL